MQLNVVSWSGWGRSSSTLQPPSGTESRTGSFSSYSLTFSFPDKFLSTSISIVRLGTLTAIPNKIRSSLKNVLVRFQAGKVLMLLAITSWVAFTLPIGYIHPPVVRYFSSDILRFFITIHWYLQLHWHLIIIIIHNSLSSCKAWNGSRYLLQEPKYTREHENLERKKRWDNDHLVPLWDFIADQLVLFNSLCPWRSSYSFRSLPLDIMPLFPLGDLDIDGDQSNHKRSWSPASCLRRLFL